MLPSCTWQAPNLPFFLPAPRCSPTDTCPCPCNYATDPNCACRDLNENITVAATKSAVYARYPLTFYKYMNGRPYEVRCPALPLGGGGWTHKPSNQQYGKQQNHNRLNQVP